MLTDFVMRLLSRIAPKVPKSEANRIMMPKATIIMAAVSKCSNLINTCSPMPMTARPRICKMV